MDKIIRFMIIGYMPIFAVSHLLLGNEPAGGLLIELYTLACIGLLVLYRPVRSKQSVVLRYVTLGLFSYIALMGTSSIFFGNPYASKMLSFLIDSFGDIKFFVLAVAFYYIVPDKERAIRTFCLIMVAIASVNAVFILRDIAIGGTSLHGLSLLQRGGITVPFGIFDHKVTSAQFMVLGAISALSLTYQSPHRAKYILVAFAFTALAFTHMSIKENVSILICFLAYFLFFNKAVKPVRSALICVAMLLVGGVLMTDNFISQPLYDRLDLFTSLKTVRTVSYTASVDIANTHFPLGSGAGTFMSKSAAQLAYSPYYYWYDIAFLHGGKPDEEGVSFLFDTYWPKILAQGGWLALLAFGGAFVFALIYAFYRYTQNSNTQNMFAFFSLLFVFISSLATSMITFDYIAPVLSLSLGWLFARSSTYQQNNAAQAVSVQPKRFQAIRP